MHTNTSIRCLFALAMLGSCAQAEEAIDLFDGKTLEGWVTLDGKPVSEGWEVADGTLHLAKRRAKSIVTKSKFENFELEFEWRVAEGGNSGVKYLVRELKSTRWGKRFFGCEYQLLDDSKHKNGRKPITSAGALYGLYAPAAEEKRLKPLVEFNRSKIIVDHGRIEHWLNGQKIVEATIGSDDWQSKVSKSKFSTVQGFAEGPGVIMLQDHGAETWFRNIRLKKLPKTELIDKK